MELKHFISETLSQLIEGITEAQKNVEESTAKISPNFSYTSRPELLLGKTPDGTHVISVDFDIAIDVQEGTKTQGGIGVVSGIFNLGSAGESSANKQSMNKIKFSIPVALPQHPYRKNKD